MTIMIIMIIRCGSKVLTRAVELKQVINKQWPNIIQLGRYPTQAGVYLEIVNNVDNKLRVMGGMVNTATTSYSCRKLINY